MAEEIIDIFDDKYRHIGEAGKREAHEKGYWHRVFICILVNPTDETVILQTKQKGHYDFDRPDEIDLSVGGHYQTGEDIPDGIRELQEEVGIQTTFDQLIPIGVRQTAATVTPTYIANEFQHIFICPIDQDLKSFELDPTEVDGLVEIPIEEGLKLLRGEIDEVQTRKLRYTKAGKKKITKISVSRDNFVKAYLEIDQLFLRLFVAAKRYSNGEDPKNIFW